MNFENLLEKLDDCGGEMVLDISSVRRLDAGSLASLEKVAAAADSKGVRVVLRGVDVDVYRVLKLVKLSARFSFVN
jgi:anti-anti-sigma regulatory factor